MNTAYLAGRGVVRVSGEDAEGFLQGLLTCDMAAIGPQQAAFGALLSPQGKILFDFFVYRVDKNDFLFDTPPSRAEAFAKRLGFYKLRARVIVEDLSASQAIAVGWHDAAMPANAIAATADPRLAALGWRTICLRPANMPADTGEEAYHNHRIALYVPEGGTDFPFDDTFPHEADMDQLHGISFNKGCYVGQEVVSRMQHRGTARTRAIGARYAGSRPPALGSDITADSKTIGRVGSGANGNVVVMIRIDKAAEAMSAHAPLTADGLALTLVKPDWARFEITTAAEGQPR